MDGFNNGFDHNIDFNRYTNLDNVETRIVMDLLNSDSKHAERIWKMLAYPTSDCLLKPQLTRKEKINLIYTDVGLSDKSKVFITPFVDDAFAEQTARLDVYVERVLPINHITSQINICFEIIVHNKIMNIINDASDEDKNTNPSELDEDGNPIILNKSRATTMLKNVLAEYNGKMVAGIGQLQHNTQMNPYCVSRQYVWNNRSFIGYAVVFSTYMSGVSNDAKVGY